MSDRDYRWDEEVPAAERVRMVALAVGEPRTANWIAEEADVAHETAVKYLQRLVDAGRVKTDGNEGRRRYRPDPVGQHLHEVRELYDEHTADELAASLEDINTRILSWKDEFDVDTPNELRATLASTADADAERDRREIADEWEYLISRRSVIEDALGLYDRFPENSAPASV